MTTNNDVLVFRSQDLALALSSNQTSNFKIKLPSIYNNVVQLSLLSASIPNNFYQINYTNGYGNGIYFIGPNNSVQTTILFSLSDGNYSVYDVCDSLLLFLQTNFLTALSVPVVSSVDYDPISGKISWTSSAPMGCFIATNKLNKVLGLDSYYTGLPYSVLTSPTLSTVLGSLGSNHFVINTNGTYTNTFNYPAFVHPVNEILIKLINVRPNVYTSSNVQATFRVQVVPQPAQPYYLPPPLPLPRGYK